MNRESTQPQQEDLSEGADQAKGSDQILREEIFQGLHELERSSRGLLLSGLSAGLDVGFSVFFMAVTLTLMGGSLDAPLAHALVANMYAVGFIFVIVGRSELFTEHTALAVFPVLDGRATVKQLLRLWTLVYVANVVGAAAMGFIVVYVGSAVGAADRSAFATIGEHLLDHPSGAMFLSALLAGWLMGLLSWLVTSASDTTARIIIVWMVTGGIGLAGLHHCIAGTAEVVAALLTSPSIGWGDLARFLLWATAGNTVGGVLFVALVKYGHAASQRRWS